MVSLKTITSLSIYNKIKNGKYALTKCSDKKRESESYIIYVYRARNNGRSTDNVRTDCGFDRSNFRLAGHVDRSKFNRIENEINLRFLLFSCFSCYLSSRCVLRNFDMFSWWHATRAVVYISRIETDIGIRPLLDCSQSPIFPCDRRDRAIIPDVRPLGTYKNQDGRH